MRRIILSSIVSISLLGSACTIDGTKSYTKPAFVPPEPTPAYVPPTPTPVTRKVVILHTNDEHSHLLGFGSYADYPFLPDANGQVTPTVVGEIATKVLTHSDQQTLGGFVRRQYLVNKIRSESTDPVLLLSAGDSTMGTIFHPATPLAAPDFMAMSLLGYDFTTIGNHEFDFGPDVLAEALNVLGTNTFGGGMQFVASNMHFDDVVTHTTGHPLNPGEALKDMYGDVAQGAKIVPWATKTLANGLKVGFLGYMGFQAALVAPASSPISFSWPMTGATCTTSASCGAGGECVRGHCGSPTAPNPTPFLMAIAGDIQPVVTQLRDVEKCDVVVALSHSGTTEDEAMATFVHGIDVIIGGHTHELTPPTVVTNGSGKTIVVQAGWYGRWLGQLTLTVDPDGKVDYVAADSTDHVIDYNLDADILAGSDLTAPTPVLSPAFEHALNITGGVFGPIMAQLNPLLGAAFPEIPSFNVVAPLVSSDHDIVGEAQSADSALAHLVTDAELQSLAGAACLPSHLATAVPTHYVVAVQANGVLRESLVFGKTSHATTFADLFSVVPLGASPFAQTSPGYPAVMFHLDPPSLFAGLDLGVTTGLAANDFFLSYSGMRITYDKSFAPLDPADLQKDLGTGGVTTPTGRVMTVEMNTGTVVAPVWTEIYHYTAGVPFYGRWSNIDIAGGEKILVITNMYLASFLAAFGLTPYDPYTGEAISPFAPFGALDVVGQTILCMDLAQTCTIAPGVTVPLVRPCLSAPANIGTDMTGGQWAANLVEVKEWAVLTKFLLNPAGFDGTIPSAFYTSPVSAAEDRVKDVTP